MKRDEHEVCILVVDDARDTLEILERNLVSRGYRVVTARAVGEATRILESTFVDLVITDYKMPQVDGLDLVRNVNENYKNTEIMMITGYPSIGGAVKAVKMGACEYLEKPFTEQELFSAVDRALNKVEQRKIANRSANSSAYESFGIVGESKPMQKIMTAIDRASSSMANVLITGESGTGKELVARAIHYQSNRAASPFVPVNCGGIPEGLLESELFGHIKGSFTGATESRIGFFQAAEGGTIFLDEISETSRGMQVKLLRALQDKEICMVGDSKPRKVDVRIVAATNKDLEHMTRTGSFRNDLFYRLSVITIHVPPLRERENDVLILAVYFAQKYAQAVGRKPIRFSENAMRLLMNYYWPGNVRELENVIQRLLVMRDDDVVEAADLPQAMRVAIPNGSGLHRTLEEVELEHIKNVLSSVKGNKTRAAEILGIDRKTLRQKIDKYKNALPNSSSQPGK